MKVLIDTNVIMDVLTRREPHFAHSLAVMKLCGAGVTGCIAASQTTDIFYLLRRYGKSGGEAKAVVGKLRDNLTVADVRSKDVDAALELPMPDFEDALAAQIARRIKADVIITRNEKDFARSPVPALSPADFLKGKNAPLTRVSAPNAGARERDAAFERLMNFPKRLPADFDRKKELMEAIDERFGSVD